MTTRMRQCGSNTRTRGGTSTRGGSAAAALCETDGTARAAAGGAGQWRAGKSRPSHGRRHGLGGGRRGRGSERSPPASGGGSGAMRRCGAQCQWIGGGPKLSGGQARTAGLQKSTTLIRGGVGRLQRRRRSHARRGIGMAAAVSLAGRRRLGLASCVAMAVALAQVLDIGRCQPAACRWHGASTGTSSMLRTVRR